MPGALAGRAESCGDRRELGPGTGRLGLGCREGPSRLSEQGKPSPFFVPEILFRAQGKLCRRVGKAWEGLAGPGAGRAVPGCLEGSGRPVPGAPCPFWDRGDFGRGEGHAGMQRREDTARPGAWRGEPVSGSRKSRFASRESRVGVSGRPGLGVGRSDRILGLRKSGWRCGKSCSAVL